jgi:hypothetical protein
MAKFLHKAGKRGNGKSRFDPELLDCHWANQSGVS